MYTAKKLHDCPVCGKFEAWRVYLEEGDDTVGIGRYLEIAGDGISGCDCILTQEQADAILDPWYAADALWVINELLDDPI